jgi:hypothetical protein
MVKGASWTLLVLLAVCGVAHGADAQEHASKLSQWSSVGALPQSTLIEVLTEHHAGPDSCRISSVDDNSLTCSPEGAESDARLVFPRSAVRDVWVIEPAHDRHIWICVAIGFALGAVLCGGGGPGPLLICGAIGALIAVDIAPGADQPGMLRVGYPGSIRIPRRPRLHRRLLYHPPYEPAVSP